MRIVSQDRDYSADFNRCEMKREANSIQCIAPSGKKTVGLYETDERAAEIFSEIHQKYGESADAADLTAAMCRSLVYYMPEA